MTEVLIRGVIFILSVDVILWDIERKFDVEFSLLTFVCVGFLAGALIP